MEIFSLDLILYFKFSLIFDKFDVFISIVIQFIELYGLTSIIMTMMNNTTHKQYITKKKLMSNPCVI